MFRINIQDNLVVSIESMHHVADLTKIEGIVVDDTIFQFETLPANYEQDIEGNIIRIYDYLIITTDRSQIIADGIDTATITATVDDHVSTAIIELWLGAILVDSQNAVNGVSTFQITMTQVGVLELTVKSTTKYGQTTISIEGV